MSNKALIIIDMQNSFKASTSIKTIKACKNEIKKAIKNNVYILFVEYFGYGKTHESLTSLVKEYKNYRFTTKSHDDGSNSIKRLLNREKWNISLFDICGVNTDFCVASTVEGLENKYPDATIRIISRACNSEWDPQAINSIKVNQNVKIV